MKTLFTVVFVVTCFFAISQEDYLVTIKGDTIYGEVGFIAETSFDEIVIKNDSEKQTFKPYQISSSAKNGELYLPIVFGNRHQMGKVIIVGSELSLFHIRPFGEFEFATKIFIKQSGETFLVPNISFRKQTSRFLKDCIGLSTKISNGDYTSSDLKAIVEEYNGLCFNPVNDERSPIDQMREFNNFLNEVFSYVDSGEPIPESLRKSLSKYNEQNISDMINKILKDKD